MKASKKTTIESIIRSGESVIQPIVGVSMMPMLDRHTDAVKLIKPQGDIQIGDVVLYRNASNGYILHRVCKIEEGAFVIRGDNCFALERVKKKNIVAVMDGYVKKGKYIPNDDPEYREYVKTVLSTGKPLIPKEWRYILKLYQSALTQTDAPPPPADLDWDKLFAVCHRQAIASTIATVIPKLNPPEDILRKFAQAYDTTLKRTILFDSERKKILCELQKQHIRAVPLKGILIKEQYPKIAMRDFSDNDILYDKTRKKDVVRTMTSLGYQVKSLKGIHDVFYKQPIFNFEMHRSLFVKESPYAQFFSDVLNRSVLLDGGYRMSDEDFYLHFLAHYAKHDQNAGSGLRSLGDLYFLDEKNKNNPAFNRKYVDEALEKMGLSSFEKEVLTLSDELFLRGQMQEKRLRYIMSGSIYGNMNNIAINAIRKKGKLGYFLTMIFPPLSSMRMRYSILTPLPVLLPICWAIRLIHGTVKKSKRQNAKNQLKVYREVSKNPNVE